MFKNKGILQSFKVAVLGLTGAFKEEKNFRIQFIIALVVVFFMIVLGLNNLEKAILILTILVVLSLELINSQIEKFLDIVQPEHHPKVMVIKDFSAAAVLLSIIGSVIIGILIFYPYLIT